MNRTARATAVAALSGVTVFGHLIYPALLWRLSRRRDEPRPPQIDGEWPAVTMLVPAYREARGITAKIADARANGYPGSLRVIVIADGDPETAAVARSAGADLVIERPERRGKPAALNAGLDAADTDVVVMTDANTTLAPGSIARLVSWFQDPTVMGVTAAKQVEGTGESVYWAYESELKRWENRLGTTIAVDGALTAVRRSHAPRFPDGVPTDDIWLGLAMAASGDRMVYDHEASSSEPGPESMAEDWERRVRVVANGDRVIWDFRRLLWPGDRPGHVTLQLWGHRVVRQTIGPMAHAVLLAGLVPVAARRDDPDRLVARLALAGHAIAALSFLAGERAPRPLRPLGQVLYLQAVGLGGSVRYARGGIGATWAKADR